MPPGPLAGNAVTGHGRRAALTARLPAVASFTAEIAAAILGGPF